MDTRTAARFAHKPIDAAHRERLLHVRGLWLCRGCTALFAGFVLGCAVAAVAVPPLPASAALVAVAALLSHPARYGRLANPVRDAVRATLGAASPWCVLAALAAGNWVDAAVVAWALLAAGALVARARRRSAAPPTASAAPGARAAGAGR